MSQRLEFTPFYRMNKSVLFLGLKWEDMIPAIITFIFMNFIFKSLFVSSVTGVGILITSAILRKKHRDKILRDVFLKLFEKDIIYVSRTNKNRSFKPYIKS